MERLVTIGEKMGLTGAELRQFVTDQQTIEREERQKERELKKEEQEAVERARRETAKEAERARKEKAEAAERERQHALEIKRLELEAARIKDAPIRVDHTSAAKLPKIASFQDGKDELDSYLLRFEIC